MAGASGKPPEHTMRTGDMVRVEEMPSSGSVKKREKTELRRAGVHGVVVKVDSGERLWLRWKVGRSLM